MLRGERVLVRNPRAADVGNPQGLGVAGHAFHVVAELLEGEMTPDGDEAPAVELLLELGRRELSQGRHLDVLEAQLDGLVERGLHALRLLHVAQAVKLQAGRPVIALARAHVAATATPQGEPGYQRRHELQPLLHVTSLRTIRFCFRPAARGPASGRGIVIEATGNIKRAGMKRRGGESARPEQLTPVPPLGGGCQNAEAVSDQSLRRSLAELPPKGGTTGPVSAADFAILRKGDCSLGSSELPPGALQAIGHEPDDLGREPIARPRIALAQELAERLGLDADQSGGFPRGGDARHPVRLDQGRPAQVEPAMSV